VATVDDAKPSQAKPSQKQNKKQAVKIQKDWL
jgi:hypothetical protein